MEFKNIDNLKSEPNKNLHNLNCDAIENNDLNIEIDLN